MPVTGPPRKKQRVSKRPRRNTKVFASSKRWRQHTITDCFRSGRARRSMQPPPPPPPPPVLPVPVAVAAEPSLSASSCRPTPLPVRAHPHRHRHRQRSPNHRGRTFHRKHGLRRRRYRLHRPKANVSIIRDWITANWPEAHRIGLLSAQAPAPAPAPALHRLCHDTWNDYTDCSGLFTQIIAASKAKTLTAFGVDVDWTQTKFLKYFQCVDACQYSVVFAIGRYLVPTTGDEGIAIHGTAQRTEPNQRSETLRKCLPSALCSLIHTSGSGDFDCPFLFRPVLVFTGSGDSFIFCSVFHRKAFGFCALYRLCLGLPFLFR